MKNNIENILNLLDELSIVDINSLIEKIKVKYNVEYKISSRDNCEDTKNISVENTKEFSVIIEEIPFDKKISVLKSVKSLTGLGLKESKDLIDKLPCLIKDKLSSESAKLMSDELTNAGAHVKIS